MKKSITLTESKLKGIIKETIRKVINENWELRQFNYLADKERGKFNGKNPYGGKFKIGDNVIVTKSDGSTIQGVIRDCDLNLTNAKLQYDVDYSVNGKQLTVIGVPERAIELK